MSRKEIIPDTLYDLYKSLGIPVDLLDPADEFTVHDVKDLLTELPILSPRFRPNYFNFLFVRPLRLGMEEFTEFEQWCTLLYEEQRSDSPYKKKIVGNLFVVLLLKIKARFWKDYNPIYEGNRGSQIVKTFKKDLERHFRDLVGGKAERVFRAHDFAGLQHLHPSYLNNVIKSKTGRSMSVWIAGKTIAEAKSLLQGATVPIKEIAYRLGFAESTHFSAFFKKHVTVSPADYRKQQG